VNQEEIKLGIFNAILRVSQESLSQIDVLTLADVPLERPKDRNHGDWATSIAMKLSQPWGLSPREIAVLISEELVDLPGVSHVEVAGPGFINIRLEAASAGTLAKKIVDQASKYGQGRFDAPQSLTDLERLTKEYGYSGLLDPTKAVIWNPTRVRQVK
jgi:arginyl-tRNA synthetase